MLEQENILDYEEEDKEYDLATFQQRVTNRVVDMIVIGLFFSFMTGYFSALNPDYRLRLDRISLDLTKFFYEMFQMLIYYSIFEFLFGQSPGKMLTQTKVVTVEAEPPTLSKIIIRSLCRSIPFNALSVLFSTNAIGWHDTLSGTRVVQR